MNKEFVPYEQALALKELGFEEPCIYVFLDKDIIRQSYGLISYPIQVYPDRILTPLYQQAFRWFREKHNFISSVTSIFKDETKTSFEYWYYIFQKEDEETFYDTYEEAELECLKELIKIIKNK